MSLTSEGIVTSLMTAVIAGDVGTVKAMLEISDDGNAESKIEWAALTYAAAFAAWRGNTQIVGLLRQAGAGNLTPFLPRPSADQKAISNYERTALMFAAWSGDTGVVTELLDDGVDVNSQVAGDLTALMFAAWSGRLATVQALLARGADINAQTVAGSTPLMCAAASGHAGVVQVLLEAGAGVDAEAINGNTVMKDATSKGYADIGQVLNQAQSK